MQSQKYGGLGYARVAPSRTTSKNYSRCLLVVREKDPSVSQAGGDGDLFDGAQQSDVGTVAHYFFPFPSFILVGIALLHDGHQKSPMITYC